MGDEFDHIPGQFRRQSVSHDYDVESLVRLTFRLSRHINDHFGGEYAAIDDVAAALRTLCATGKGNKLIQRVVNASALSIPPISFAEPVRAGDGTILEVGAIPQLKPYAPNHAVLSLLDWLETPALVAAYDMSRPLPGKVQRCTWSDLINELANVRGSHATQWIERWLVPAQLGGVSGVALTDYLIESAALVVEDQLRHILHALGHGLKAPEARIIPVPQRPLGVDWFRIRNADQKLEIECAPFVNSWTKPNGVYEMIRFDFDGFRARSDVLLQGGQIIGQAQHVEKL